MTTPVDEPASKRCSKCGETKSIAEFYRKNSSRDGRQAHCKSCRADLDAARRRRRAAQGLCQNCSEPAIEGRGRCAEHLAAQADYYASPEGRAKRAAYVASGKHAERKRARMERLRLRTPEEIEVDRRRLRPSGVKRCRACREELPFSAFAGDRTADDGLNRRCMRCDHASLLRRALPRWEELGLYTCVYCWAEFEEVDHVAARALGGTDDPINLAPACSTCNRGPGGKFDRPVLEWAVERWPDLGPVIDRLPWRVEADGNNLRDL